tara:strand:- start:252 stop:1376 length:1125 start_codon:yes stop_codon:yes gene_type:complete
MIYNIYTNRDTTLHEKYPTQNTGIDQILTLAKITSGSLLNGFYQSNTYNTRILLDFVTELTEISNSIVSGEIPVPGILEGSSSFFLTLNASDASSLPISYSLMAFPVSESWDNGTGHFDDTPIATNGASWKYKKGSTEWASGSQITSGGAGGTTEAGGGTWYTEHEATASFNYESPDVRMNITSIVKHWFKNTIPNNGLILKRPTIDEQDSSVYGALNFFGVDTHTIYIPKIEVAWDDSVINTGTLTELIDDNITLYFKNLKAEYKEKTRTKLRVVGRKTYPSKTYSTASFYNVVEYLPTSSYYSIKDASTEEVIVPFNDSFTKISCDTSGNYFNVRLNGLLPERTYRFVIKTVNDGGDNTRYHDNGYYFKVVR